MSDIRAKALNQNIAFTELPRIYSGDVNVDYVHFTFDEAWDGFTKTAVFYRDVKEPYFQIINSKDDSCVVPNEVLAESGKFYMGVVGTLDDKVLTSEVIAYEIGKGVMTPSVAPPSTDIWLQLMQIYGEILELAKGFDIKLDDILKNLQTYTIEQLTSWLNDGTLRNLINDMLNITTVYDTTAELSGVDNLVKGMTIKTLGYFSVNDGGGASFIITDTSSETDYQVALQNNLYATLIRQSLLNVLAIGADNTGTKNNIELFKKVLPLYKNIYFPKGDYVCYDYGNYNTSTNSMITKGVKLSSGTNVYGSDANIKVLSNDYVGYGTFVLQNVKNVTIQNLNFVGDRETHNYTSGSSHEWGQGLCLFGCDGVTVDNCRFTNLTGDGVYIGCNFNPSGGFINNSKNILIENCYFEGIRRNCISLTNSESNTVVRNCYFKDFGYTAPKSAVDIEVEVWSSLATDIHLQNLTITKSVEFVNENGIGESIDIVKNDGLGDIYMNKIYSINCRAISASGVTRTTNMMSKYGIYLTNSEFKYIDLDISYVRPGFFGIGYVENVKSDGLNFDTPYSSVTVINSDIGSTMCYSGLNLELINSKANITRFDGGDKTTLIRFINSTIDVSGHSRFVLFMSSKENGYVEIKNCKFIGLPNNGNVQLQLRGETVIFDNNLVKIASTTKTQDTYIYACNQFVTNNRNYGYLRSNNDPVAQTVLFDGNICQGFIASDTTNASGAVNFTGIKAF